MPTIPCRERLTRRRPQAISLSLLAAFAVGWFGLVTLSHAAEETPRQNPDSPAPATTPPSPAGTTPSNATPAAAVSPFSGRSSLPLFVPTFQTAEGEAEVQRKSAQQVLAMERERARMRQLAWGVTGVTCVTLLLAWREHRKNRAKPLPRMLFHKLFRRRF